MKAEDQAWMRLRERGASRISPGFADRVLRAARAESSPLLVAHFAMCAATAALCLAAVLLYHTRASGADEATSLAGWSEIAAQASDLEQGL
jgi:hypothetical protein